MPTADNAPETNTVVDLPDWSPLQDARVIERLADGPVVDSWRIEQPGDRQRVFRADRPLARQLGLDRKGEFAVLQLASAAGLGPRPIAADPDRGWLLTDYLPGPVPSQAQFRTPGLLTSLGQLMASMHRLPVGAASLDPSCRAASIPATDLAAQAARYAKCAASSSTRVLARRIRERLTTVSSGDDVPVLCHNDVHAGNVVVNERGEPRLIDWEYAGGGDPHFDLASLIEQAALNETQSEVLLHAYNAAGGRGDSARLNTWRQIYRDLHVLWSEAIGALA